MTTSNLNSGHARNCGCEKSPDKSGQKFGQLTVIRRSENKCKRGDRWLVEWECRCDCGATVYRTTDQLTNKKDRMCAECSQKNNVMRAFNAAGFEEGTQISKIREMNLIATNTSGRRGVCWHKKQRKWVARIKFKGRIINLGSFSDFEEAVKARQRAEEEYFETFLAERDAQGV